MAVGHISILQNYIYISCIIVLFFSLLTTSVLIPSSNIEWDVDPKANLPAVQSGRIQITWNNAIGSVDHYEIEVNPLDHTDPLSNPISSGFIFVCIYVFCSTLFHSFSSLTTELQPFVLKKIEIYR